MKPAGVIITYMSRKDWKGKSFWIKLRTIFFNLCLFVWQLTFIVIGTAYGKIKWDWRKDPDFIDYIILLAFLPPAWLHILGISLPLWLRLSLFVLLLIVGVAIFRRIDWRRVWRAAQASHVRLVLEKWASFKNQEDTYSVANFGYPEMEIQPWRESWNDGKRFEYRDSTFPTPPEFMKPVIQYAEDQVGKRYDKAQLSLGYVANFTIWVFCPWLWGREVIKTFNMPGGLEVCISGLVACLRWGECMQEHAELSKGKAPGYMTVYYDEIIRIFTKFFPGYDTAVVPPCLVELDENWRRE